MNNEELLAYRQQIIEDAIRMKKKPDRTPHFANYWTWKILDSGYKLSEALYDWDKLEDSTIKFQKKYGFDMLVDDGVRDPMQVIEPIGQSSYEVDDEKEIMNIRDVSFMSPDDYDLFLKDYPRFLWEVVLPNKANRFNSDLTLEQFGEVFNRFNGYAKCTQNIVTRLNTECGTPAGMLSTQSTIPGYEQLFNFYRGIKGTASDMRRIPDKFKAACDLLDEMQLYPALEQLKTSTRRANASVDFIGLMLGHTILSIKQWEAFYWPSFKRMLDAVVAADKTCYIFSEGSTKRFWSYFKDLPKGHFAFHVEQDDIFEFKKELPNCCAVGGMHASLLGGGTKEQCVSYAKHLIDELGGEGFILSQDKMISYRNDTNPENLKAVCDFVREYR